MSYGQLYEPSYEKITRRILFTIVQVIIPKTA